MLERTQSPLPGLLYAPNAQAALEAMFSQNFDIVVLRHPDPVAFEAAAKLICNARPELVSKNYSPASIEDSQETTFIERIIADSHWRGATPEIKAAREYLKQWFVQFKDLTQRANPKRFDNYCETRVGYSNVHNPELSGFHMDYDVDLADPESWRGVLTLVGTGTRIMEQDALQKVSSPDNPMIAIARARAVEKFPLPAPLEPSIHEAANQHPRSAGYDRQANLAAREIARKHNVQAHTARAKMGTMISEILYEGQHIEAANCGDMVFISQSRPKHLVHAGGLYNGKQRLTLVLDAKAPQFT